jgi:hypothetical protein
MANGTHRTAPQQARRVSPAEAVDLLRDAGMSEAAAAAALTAAIHDGRCELWCNGAQVQQHVAITLAIEISRDGTVGITSLAREPWKKPRDTYVWRLDTRKVEALRRAPASKRRTLRLDMLLTIVGSLYPRGVSNDIGTSAVQQQVAQAWPAECKARGLKEPRPPVPGWDMVNDALGRRRRRSH